MKKKILISLVACFIAAGSFIGYNLTENTSRLDVSLADISVMAQADGENGNKPNYCRDLVNYTCYEYENKYDCFHMTEPVYPPYNCKD